MATPRFGPNCKEKLPTHYLTLEERDYKREGKIVLVLFFLSLWGASCCVMYTYIFQIHTRDRN
jgi:hypothetical protein